MYYDDNGNIWIDTERSGFAWYEIEGLNYATDKTIRITYSSEVSGPDESFEIIYQDDGELTTIMDGNIQRYHQRYNEHWPQGDEIPGDALDDVNYSNPYFSSDLGVARKDLILELV